MIDPLAPDYSNTPASSSRYYGRYTALEPKAQPVVTILTAFYNTSSVFEETAESVFKQTLQQWEWLIINDCSTDPEALKVLDKYRNSEDPRIRVIDMPENGGPSRARNFGVSKASTDYIYHLDSDDLIEPTTLEKCFWYLFSHPECPWVNGWSIGFGAEEYLWHFGYGDGQRFLEQNLVTGRTMIRKAVFEAIGGYDPDIKAGAEDWGFWLKAAEKGFWGHTIPEYFDWYRRREQHWSRWETIDDERRLASLRDEYAAEFPQIFSGDFPHYSPRPHLALDSFEDVLPADNRLKSSKPRLLMILPWMAMGGADKFNLDLMDQLDRNGWTSSIATTKRHANPWQQQFELRTPEVYSLSNFLHPSYYALFLRYLIHSRQFDAVMVSCSELGYWLLPYLKFHFPKIPFVDYSHIEEQYWKNGGHPRYGAMSQSFVERNLVTSAHLRNWMIVKWHARPEQIEVLTINVDPELWKPDSTVRHRLRKEFEIDESEPLILFAGRFCSQKQPEVLLQTLQALDEKGSPFRAVLAGDGEDFAWVKDFVRRNGLADRILLPGAVPSAEVREWMQAADIFFLPSLWEGVALSIYEAMSVGLAVVGADVGGQKELVSSDTGILIKRDGLNHEEEVDAYVRVLSDLLEDEDRRAAFGRNARDRILRYYNLDAMGDRFLKIIGDAKRFAAERTGLSLDRTFAHEQAIRALDYMRIDDLAERLWLERMQRSESMVESKELNVAVDPLREWQHIHRYIPFRMHRFWHQSVLAGVFGRSLSESCYDSRLSVGERLLRLKHSGFYKRFMALRRFPLFRPLLPRC
ncbi:MAG: glycosyltransferase [Opitutales bacterium]|nr:glycosyltransferase [Opitutales bacterium]